MRHLPTVLSPASPLEICRKLVRFVILTMSMVLNGDKADSGIDIGDIGLGTAKYDISAVNEDTGLS